MYAGDATTSTKVLTSSADEETAGYYKVDEGTSETFTLQVTYVPAAINTAARVQLVNVVYAATAVPGTQVWAAVPAADYRTATVVAVN